MSYAKLRSIISNVSSASSQLTRLVDLLDQHGKARVGLLKARKALDDGQLELAISHLSAVRAANEAKKHLVGTDGMDASDWYDDALVCLSTAHYAQQDILGTKATQGENADVERLDEHGPQAGS